MSNSELKALLAKSRVPDRNMQYWEEFPNAVSRRIQQGDKLPDEKPAHPQRALQWAFATVSAALCVWLGFWFGRHGVPHSRTNELAEARKFVAELTTMFPNQVRAMIIQNGKTELQIAERADVPQSAPVLLRVCDDSGCAKIITFSGQQVRVNGQPCDVLVDASGHVIIAGPRFVWSSADTRSDVAGLRVTARSLGETL